jgi:hypothetical protein
MRKGRKPPIIEGSCTAQDYYQGSLRSQELHKAARQYLADFETLFPEEAGEKPWKKASSSLEEELVRMLTFAELFIVYVPEYERQIFHAGFERAIRNRKSAGRQMALYKETHLEIAGKIASKGMLNVALDMLCEAFSTGEPLLLLQLLHMNRMIENRSYSDLRKILDAYGFTWKDFKRAMESEVG